MPARDPDRPDVSSSWHDAMRKGGPYLGIGMELAAMMGLFIGGGYLIDRWLGSMPWGTIIGAFFGLGMMVFYLMRLDRRLDDGSEPPDSRSASSRPESAARRGDEASEGP